MKNKPAENMEWAIRVPIFKNRIILKQLGFAIGIPFGLLIIILLIATGDDKFAWYGLGLIGVLFLLTYRFIMIVYGGKYDVEFIIDKKGILCRTQAKQARKNKVINGLTVVLGLFSGKFTAAGAGMLANARQTVLIKWGNIRRVKYYHKQYSILIKGGLTESIALFCTEEDYEKVRECIQKHAKNL